MPIGPILVAAIVAALGPAAAFVIGGVSLGIAVLLLLVPSIRALE